MNHHRQNWPTTEAPPPPTAGDTARTIAAAIFTFAALYFATVFLFSI